jgi:predicted PurR-regulated permease PerM
LVAGCLVVACLYFARAVFIPIALAVLLAFLLEPLAKLLERGHLGRTTSALAAVFLAVFLICGLSYLVVGQFGDFAKELPQYEQTIHGKLRHVREGDGGVIGQAAKSIQDFRKDLNPTNLSVSTNIMQGTNAAAAEPKAVPVVVRDPDGSTLQLVRNLIGPSVNLMVTMLLVTVFCIFILVGREDLRARLIRMAGSRNSKLTNQLLNDTGQRVARYLLMQLVVNTLYGVPIGLGLWAIGIPNPFLWGLIAAVFRYIPYAGPWIAAFTPFAIGYAIDSGWSKPVLVLALFGAIEIVTANFVEPWLYGNSTGITPLAVLLAAVFWAWLWGPVGLLLSMPLTVCLVSIARYVPQLEFLDQLFGETKNETTHP